MRGTYSKAPDENYHRPNYTGRGRISKGHPLRGEESVSRFIPRKERAFDPQIDNAGMAVDLTTRIADRGIYDAQTQVALVNAQMQNPNDHLCGILCTGDLNGYQQVLDTALMVVQVQT